jgi:hypothetical protein
MQNHAMITERLQHLINHCHSSGAICPCVLSRHRLCVIIELRPNALASPRTARLTDDIHPYLDKPAAFARSHMFTRIRVFTRTPERDSHVHRKREVV